MPDYTPKPGRPTHNRKVITHVADAECEKGGLHELTIVEVDEIPRSFCTKCERWAVDLDHELNRIDA